MGKIRYQPLNILMLQPLSGILKLQRIDYLVNLALQP